MAGNEFSFVANLKDNVSGGLEGIAKKAAAVAVGFVAVDKAIGKAAESIAEFQKSEIVIAKLGATIKAVGDRTGYTSEQLQKMATKMMGKTIFDDDAVMQAQQMLLTMQNISDDAIPAVIDAAANMSTSNEELTANAFALARAMEDPEAGFRMLKRSGIILGDELEALIKKNVELGDIETAQAMILQEVEKRYGGVAEALAKTSAGERAIAENKMADRWKEVGEALIPVEKLYTSIMGRVAEFATLSLQTFNADRWAALGDAQKRYTMQYEQYTRDQLFAEITALQNTKYTTDAELKVLQEKEAVVRGLLKDRVQTEKAESAKAAAAAIEQDKITQARKDAAQKNALQAAQEEAKKQQALRDSIAERNRAQNGKSFAEGQAQGKAEIEAEQKKVEEIEKADQALWQAEQQIARDKKIAADQEAARQAMVSDAYWGASEISGKALQNVMKEAKASANAQKAVAIGMIAMDTARASIAAWAGAMQLGIPAGLIVGAATQAALIANAAVATSQVMAQKFAQGGVVQGSPVGDMVPIRANGGEMVLTREQQANLFAMANGKSSGSSTSITIAPQVRVDSGMTAGEKQRVVAATASAVRDALIHLRNTNRMPVLA